MHLLIFFLQSTTFSLSPSLCQSTFLHVTRSGSFFVCFGHDLFLIINQSFAPPAHSRIPFFIFLFVLHYFLSLALSLSLSLSTIRLPPCYTFRKHLTLTRVGGGFFVSGSTFF